MFVILKPVITILHFEPAGGVVWDWSHLLHLVILWIKGAQGQDCLLSTVCLFPQSLSSTCFSLKAFPKISCT